MARYGFPCCTAPLCGDRSSRRSSSVPSCAEVPAQFPIQLFCLAILNWKPVPIMEIVKFVSDPSSFKKSSFKHHLISMDVCGSPPLQNYLLTNVLLSSSVLHHHPSTFWTWLLMNRAASDVVTTWPRVATWSAVPHIQLYLLDSLKSEQ